MPREKSPRPEKVPYVQQEPETRPEESGGQIEIERAIDEPGHIWVSCKCGFQSNAYFREEWEIWRQAEITMRCPACGNALFEVLG